MRNFWVFNIGTADEGPAENWLAEWTHHTHEMWFPPNKRPSGVHAGDRAVVNGAGRVGFIAAVEVTSTEPEPNQHPSDANRSRWPWKLDYKLLVAISGDHHAPSLEDVGWENPRSLRRQSHISIDQEMYERVAMAIVNAARRAVAS